MNPVQNQGCGDCWAFAGVGAVEAAWVFGNIELIMIQLNDYETVPYFHQLSQNLTSDCLLILVFLPVFTSFCMI